MICFCLFKFSTCHTPLNPLVPRGVQIFSGFFSQIWHQIAKTTVSKKLVKQLAAVWWHFNTHVVARPTPLHSSKTPHSLLRYISSKFPIKSPASIFFIVRTMSAPMRAGEGAWGSYHEWEERDDDPLDTGELGAHAHKLLDTAPGTAELDGNTDNILLPDQCETEVDPALITVEEKLTG